MKVAISVTMLLTVATVLLWLPVPPPVNNLQIKEEQAASQQGKSEERRPVIATSRNPNARNSSSETTKKNSDTLDVLYKGFTAVSGLVSIGIFFLVLRQLKAMRSIERAWLLQSVKDVHDLPLKPSHTWKGKGAFFEIKNWGKTPGRMTQITAKVIAVKDVSDLQRLAKCQGEILSDIEGRPMAPGEIATFSFDALALKSIAEQEWEDIADGTKILAFYAEVKYRDIFHKRRTTKFCYRYERREFPRPPTAEPYGGGKYNKAS